MQNGHNKSQDLRITGEFKYHDTVTFSDQNLATSGVGLHFQTKT